MNAKATYTAALVWTALMVTLAKFRWLTAAREFITTKTHPGGAT